MSFLIGAYGKLMAGKRYRSLQFRLTQVMSKIQRVTRQAADVERMLTSQQQNAQRMMKASMNSSIFGLQAGIYQNLGLTQYMGKDMSKETEEVQRNYATAMTEANMKIQQQQQYSQMMMSGQAQQMDQYFEAVRESQLEPLRNYEDSLQVEKGSLESQVELAKNDYESMKEMEKAGAKDYVPEYTGQG